MMNTNPGLIKIIDSDIQWSIIIYLLDGGTLKYFEGRTLTALTKSDPWPDFTAQEGTTNWAIELTELIEPEHGAAYKLQQSKLGRLAA